MNSVTLAIVGSGGAGVVSLGELVLKAAANVGYYGLMRKSFGPQIRGGESAAIIRLSTHPVENFSGDIQCVVALDWNNFSRFGDEIPIKSGTFVIQDLMAGSTPEGLESENITTLDFSGTAESVGSSKANMAAFGLIGALLKCDANVLERLIRARLAKFDETIQAVSVAAMEAGQSLFDDANSFPDLLPKLEQSNSQGRWIATGNQLAGLGALEAGVKFVAAYPITPASDCLEWIANNIETVDGHLVQAED
ncbi:MAG: 2-oxoacid:acceptor oxidoreductase family protein, partial [Pseudomonadales bacterium]|nr:2-oxoacid:acceptor oxidoreductase family protein [Pseudomonadales bacterium]